MQPQVKGESNTDTQKDEQKMVDKVNQQMDQEDDSLMARVIGLGLILFGFIFVVLTVVVLILSNRSARIDENLDIPTLKVQQYTNNDTIEVQGTTTPDGDVIFFVDGEEADVTITADEDGNFSGEIPVPDDEKEYEITVASVEGFPLRRRSKQTEPIAIIVDKTLPSNEVELDYDPISKDGKVSFRGKAEAGAVITITNGETDYVTIVAEDGTFELDDIELLAKESVLKMKISDVAGNEVSIAREIAVSYPDYDDMIAGGGDINGPGAETGPDDGSGNGSTDGKENPDLPEAAGPLEDAMDIILGNQLMTMFGMVAVTVLMVNSGLVALKASKK